MFEFNRRAQVLSKSLPIHPAKAPACSGNGEWAMRWDGKHFQKIPCPTGPEGNSLCQYAQPREDGPTPCKPFGRFLFRPRWAPDSPLPAPLMKLTTGSWNSVRAFKGFFEYIQKQAALMGLADFSLYGMPFVLTLSKKSSPKQQRAYPVMSISPDCDLQAFIATQAARRSEMMAVRPLAALTDGSERAADEEYADLATISPGIPRQEA